MTSNKRRKFTAEFPSQVVLEVLSGTLSVAQAAKKYKIKDNSRSPANIRPTDIDD